jgi:hypothetical protein
MSAAVEPRVDAINRISRAAREVGYQMIYRLERIKNASLEREEQHSLVSHQYTSDSLLNMLIARAALASGVILPLYIYPGDNCAGWTDAISA